jgi:TRAP transporter 4TM/12TM fusion protein
MSPKDAPRSSSKTVIAVIYYAAACAFFAYLFSYYMTGTGGPSLLAVTMVPIAFVIYVLESLRKDTFYPALGALPNYLIATVYIALSVTVAFYMNTEFEEIGTVRAGFWNTPDMVFGGLMVLLILEFARKQFIALFIINIILILYCVYGWAVPGMFNHPGLDWERVVTAMSVESATGIFSRLPQLALTLIGSFILVLSVLRAFGCVDSILKAASQLAARSPHALPISAVLGSLGVAAVSGSGAANAITTGSATIPSMIGAGMPRPQAAAIEGAASLGGQLMPPIMGISAFLMAEFLGESYFDVVARGYAPAVVYFVGVLAGVYLLSVRHGSGRPTIAPEPMLGIDWINLGAFLVVVFGLILLMAILHMAPMFAAIRIFFAITAVLYIAAIVRPLLARKLPTPRALAEPAVRFIDTFTSMTSDLTLLLATLSIMVGAFAITGVPTKVGFLLLDAAGVNLLAMVLVAFFFGALLGTGLPPAPTYILTALVIAPPMIKAGVNPWCVHFFAFFLAVWGELTPPTSVVAAVTAKIAETSFIATLFRAIKLCASLFVLMAAAFVRPELVLEPGAAQLGALGLVATSTVALTFALQARFSEAAAQDYTIRIVLATFAMLILFYPDALVAALACIPAAAIIGFWFLRRRDATAKPAIAGSGN